MPCPFCRYVLTCPCDEQPCRECRARALLLSAATLKWLQDTRSLQYWSDPTEAVSGRKRRRPVLLAERTSAEGVADGSGRSVLRAGNDGAPL